MLRNTEVVFYPKLTQKVTVGAASAATTNGVSQYVAAVRVLATTDCYVEIGASPVATTSSMFVMANFPETFRIREGQKVAVIQQVNSGTLYITEMTH